MSFSRIVSYLMILSVGIAIGAMVFAPRGDLYRFRKDGYRENVRTGAVEQFYRGSWQDINRLD